MLSRIRPRTMELLSNLHSLYELHICTFGARMYAHKIAAFLGENFFAFWREKIPESNISTFKAIIFVQYKAVHFCVYDVCLLNKYFDPF